METQSLKIAKEEAKVEPQEIEIMDAKVPEGFGIKTGDESTLQFDD